MVVVLFSVIQTFADFQIVYVMTGGGPANATHLFATYAYQLGVGTGLLSQGAAVSLAMFPILFADRDRPAPLHPLAWRPADDRRCSLAPVGLLPHSRSRCS